MKERRQRFLNDCYTRDEFFSVFDSKYIIYNSNSNQKEEFTDYSICKGSTLHQWPLDSLDFTIYMIHYPMPIIREIFIKNWAGGWETDQSYIHLEYQDYVWVLKKILNFKKNNIEETEKTIDKSDIFYEIFDFINHIDPEIAKNFLRNFNLMQLI